MLKIALGIIVAAALDKYLNSPPFPQHRIQLHSAAVVCIDPLTHSAVRFRTAGCSLRSNLMSKFHYFYLALLKNWAGRRQVAETGFRTVTNLFCSQRQSMLIKSGPMKAFGRRTSIN